MGRWEFFRSSLSYSGGAVAVIGGFGTAWETLKNLGAIPETWTLNQWIPLWPWHIWVILSVCGLFSLYFEGSFRKYVQVSKELTKVKTPLVYVRGISVSGRSDKLDSGVTSNIVNAYLDIYNPRGQTKTVHGIAVTIMEGEVEGRSLQRCKLRCPDHEMMQDSEVSLNPGDEKGFAFASYEQRSDGQSWLHFRFARPNGTKEALAKATVREDMTMKMRVSGIDTPDQELLVIFGVKDGKFHASISEALTTTPIPYIRER